MAYQEEPAYRQHEGKCRQCGQVYIYYNSVKRHPDHDICDDCERVKIVETLTGLPTIGEGNAAVKGWG
ncbi:hypothetical protein LCGC14_2534240 [marine sediment metagenome]|uniref:Uncharacterized protein n=1 Tax=marine sediment metagenome TaxID=412755 RepID=A0A0F9AT03_9ZZZZ